MKFKFSILVGLCVFGLMYSGQIGLPERVSAQPNHAVGVLATRTVAPTPTFALTSPCETFFQDEKPIPFLDSPAVQILHDERKAIDYSETLLRCRGRVHDYRPLRLATRIQFRDGTAGMFVALSYPGLRGFQLVYLEENNRIILSQFRQTTEKWGLEGRYPVHEVPLKDVVLFSGASQRQFIITGQPSYGTNIDVQNFEIINVGNKKLEVIFRGTDFDIGDLPGEWDKRYQYGYADLDKDTVKEIVKTGSECNYARGEPLASLRIINCFRVLEIFKYDGLQYNPILREKTAHKSREDF